MSEIQVTAATSAKDQEAFTTQVKNHVSKVANLCGWEREERDTVIEAVDASDQVAWQWKSLQKEAATSKTMPVWEWNKFVRNATDDLVARFYLG